ncbi:unnamed protein product, partial [Discosporangium mesarthrocarpum]
RCRFLLDFAKTMLAPIAGHEGKDAPFSGVLVTSGALGWATAAASTRAFRLGGPGCVVEGRAVAEMVPFLDMANHSYHPNAKVTP